MEQEKLIIDYIIEQAERFDIKNLQFEEDIKFNLRRLTDAHIDRVLNCVKTDINKVLDMQVLMTSIQRIYDIYFSQCEHELVDKIGQYYDTAYDNMGELIDIGIEVTRKFTQGLSEQNGNKEYDEDTIQYIEEHAFELLKGHNNQKIERIRSELGDLFLKGKANKANVRAAIERILDVNRSKAEEIAQTELSRAYNIGSVNRLIEYKNLSGRNIKKYWHGFKYSAVTCDYCRERIGSVYELEDDVEQLPAHPRCRCVWLPFIDGWDKPISRDLLFRANMLNTIYSRDMMYQRINNRLGINYAEYMTDESMEDYLSGDRSNKVQNAMYNARNQYIDNAISNFDIAKDNSRGHMSVEYNDQMKFWKQLVAGAMADNDIDLLSRAQEAIKGVMILPWSAEQLDGWDKLIDNIMNFK